MELIGSSVHLLPQSPGYANPTNFRMSWEERGSFGEGRARGSLQKEGGRFWQQQCVPGSYSPFPIRPPSFPQSYTSYIAGVSLRRHMDSQEVYLEVIK